MVRLQSNKKSSPRILTKKKKPIIIFGTATLAELAHFYFTVDAKRKVVAFTVDRQYYEKNAEIYGLPVIPFDRIERHFSPQQYDVFVALGPMDNNQVRAKKVEEAKTKGYGLASYISSRAEIADDVSIGEHVLIVEDVQIKPQVTIGHNVFIWRHSHIEKNARILDHCYLSEGAQVGAAGLKSGTFIERNKQALYQSLEGRRLTTKSSKNGSAGLPQPKKFTSLKSRLNWLGIALEYFEHDHSSQKNFRKYIDVVRSSVSLLPEWLFAVYYQTLWHIPRAQLLSQKTLFYKGIFHDMRDIKRRFADHIETKLKLKVRTSKPAERRLNAKKRRVLFTLPYVVRNDTTVVNVAKKFKMIQRYWPDAEFYILVGDDFYVSQQDFYNFKMSLWDRKLSGPINSMPQHNPHSRTSCAYIKKVCSEAGVKVHLQLTNSRLPYLDRMCEALQWVHKINPTVVLSFSMESVLDTVIYRHFPSIRFGLGELIPIFSTDADYYVTQFNVKDLAPLLRDHKLSKDIPSYKHVHFPVKAIKSRDAVTKKSFGLSENFFYVASISRHFDVGVFEDVCEVIKSFLDRHHDARWLLVGINSHKPRPRALLHDRIDVIQDCKNGIGFASVMDVLLPVTPGTGITALSAMMAGVPVLSMSQRPCPYSASGHTLPPDVAIFLGEENASNSLRELGNKLERLYSDHDYCGRYKRTMKERATNLIKQRHNLAREQFGCIEEGLLRGQQRLLRTTKKS